MSTTYRLILAAVLVVSLSACGSQQSKMDTDKSLYARLGGQEAISAVVIHLWGVVSKDERINGYFSHTQPEAFAGLLTDFLCMGTGGPCEYKGRSMAATHVGMNVSSDAFDALAEDVVTTLTHFKVPAQEQGEVMSLLGSMKSDVINH